MGQAKPWYRLRSKVVGLKLSEEEGRRRARIRSLHRGIRDLKASPLGDPCGAYKDIFLVFFYVVGGLRKEVENERHEEGKRYKEKESERKRERKSEKA